MSAPRIAAPPTPTTTPMMVLRVFTVMPVGVELSALRAAVSVVLVVVVWTVLEPSLLVMVTTSTLVETKVDTFELGADSSLSSLPAVVLWSLLPLLPLLPLLSLPPPLDVLLTGGVVVAGAEAPADVVEPGAEVVESAVVDAGVVVLLPPGAGVEEEDVASEVELEDEGVVEVLDVESDVESAGVELEVWGGGVELEGGGVESSELVESPELLTSEESARRIRPRW